MNSAISSITVLASYCAKRLRLTCRSEAARRNLRDREGAIFRLDSNEPVTETIVDAPFPDNPLLCCGWDFQLCRTKPRQEWERKARPPSEKLKVCVKRARTALHFRKQKTKQ